MKHVSHVPRVTLFPFLSVLLSTMGVLAFLSISFLLVVPDDAEMPVMPKRLQFEWVGAPGYVKPIFIRCFKDRVEYYNMFENREYTLSLDQLLDQLQGEEPEFPAYLVQLAKLNKSIKKQFGNTEYYPCCIGMCLTRNWNFRAEHAFHKSLPAADFGSRIIIDCCRLSGDCKSASGRT